MTLAAKYTRPAIALHWLIAVLILVNVCLGWSTRFVDDSAIRPIIDNHKSIGITVLGLAIMRLLWRFAHPPPPFPPSYAPWERVAAHAAHWLLYALIFALPLSGWLHDSAWKAAPEVPMRWFGLFEWPRIGLVMNLEPALKERMHDVFGAFHFWFGVALYALFALHVAGALKHQFADREPELQRMLP